MSNASQNLPDAADLEEFVAECDEHLVVARRVLLDLESAGDLAAVERGLLDDLFRGFHTIKGLSGMVGARAAEEIAHLLEAYLAAVRKGEVALSQPAVDVLLEGVGLLTGAIDAFRTGAKTPDVTAIAARVKALLPERPATVAGSPRPVDTPAAPTIPADRATKIAIAIARGERAWRAAFNPTPELAARGINVGSVRSRIQAVGEIVHAEPVATAGGIRFRFLVTTPATVDPQSWAGEGVVVEPYEVEAAPELVAAAPRQPAAGVAPSQLVRVDLRRLDDLMHMVGELVLSRARLQSALERAAGHLPAKERRDLDDVVQVIEHQLRDLREGVMRVRMVPVGDLFSRMRLVVRDIAREAGKEVDLVVSGQGTEIDKFVIERMADPLLHLVRNAVSHGLESPADRIAAGKPAKGQVTLRASTAAGTVVLEVEDDGRGIRPDDIIARARESGLLSPSAPIDSTTVLDLLCTPGFSTRDTADRASGRGVGMDVVRVAVEGLGGTLTLDARPGRGTRFSARLPLTLVVADVLTVAVGDQTYAVPQSAVREVVAVEPGSTTVLAENELLRRNDAVLPLLRIGDLFGATRHPGGFVALVSGEGNAAVALAADRAIGLREVVVRPLSDPLVQVPGVGGATELGDGRPILILDPPGLVRLARRRVTSRGDT